MSATADQELAELRRANAKLLKERDAALAEAQACSAALSRRNSEHGEQIEQQAATIEVLKAMSASPGNPQPVFDLIVERARTCCSAELAALTLLDGDLLRLEATSSMTAARAEQFAKAYPLHVSQAFAGGRAILLRETVQVPDTTLDPGFAHRGTNDWHRSVLAVPLLRTGTPIGAIGLGRPTAGTFSQAQVELLKTFAEQAVIAITSAETYHELQERTAALARRNDEFGERIEHQSATIEVLKAMSASPGDKKPIFDLIVRRAVDLCNAQSGGLFEYDGNLVSIGTIHGLFEHNGELVHVETLQGNEQDIEPSALRSYLRQFPMAPSRGSVSMRAILDNRLLHIRDMRAEDLIDDVRRLGHRSQVSVPLRQSGRAIGVITMAANEPGGFSDSQVALLQTFAEQAVIAITSAETYRALQTRTADLQESLDYQTATSDVLKVISGSGFALEPVFKTVVDTAARLCHADQAMIFRLEDDAFLWAAGTDMVVPEHGRRVRSFPIRPGTGTLIGRVALQGRPVQILDGQTDPLLDPEVKESGRIGGVHTSLGVPLVRDGVIIGAIGLARRRIEPFTDQQIELVSTFADQAVIAIENTRLLTEQQEALEQQTATAEVLQVINSSPGNLAPVFESILDKAHGLCGATVGSLFLYDGRLLRAVATQGFPQQYSALLRQPFLPGPGHRALIKGERLLHILDIQALELGLEAEERRRSIVQLGLHTFLLVPLRKDGALLGLITAARDEVRPFSDKEISLLENFAAQAVIAMENARLLSEVRQREEELRITFENMGDGVAMFDETPRLVAWNRKFQDIMDLPDGVLADRPTFPDYIRYLAERGEYGSETDPEEEIRNRVAEAGRYRANERVRPDGRIIEIRQVPVAGGGFVMVVSDITERKRNEDQIRAARDAAEEASRAIEAAYRELKAAQASLIQAEKMASLGQLTAGIAHEIKNPLNFVNNFASLSIDLLDELKQAAAPGLAMLDNAHRAEIDELASTLASNLGKINEHGRRADGIVRGMLEHSRGSSGERRSVDLNTLVEEALNLAYHGARAQDQNFNVTLQREFGEGIAPVTLAPQDVTRVLLNLCSNGFYAARERGRVETTSGFEPILQIATREIDNAVEIQVRDNGTGIPSEIKDRLFQPFFTTKPPGEGTGLGLSMSYEIITQQHGGSITVDSKVGEYSEFTIRLPRRT